MDEVRTELADSKKWLEDLLGRAVDSMSLPGGSANREVIRLAWETGYDLVGTSRERMNRLVSLPSTVDRFVVQHGYGVRHIARMLHGSLSYVAPRGVRALLVWLPKKLLRTAERRRAD
jgi:peptidoglycan/xylan/chitin deacetylase (PgdA/CDA1 family)